MLSLAAFDIQKLIHQECADRPILRNNKEMVLIDSSHSTKRKGNYCIRKVLRKPELSFNSGIPPANLLTLVGHQWVKVVGLWPFAPAGLKHRMTKQLLGSDPELNGGRFGDLPPTDLDTNGLLPIGILHTFNRKLNV